LLASDLQIAPERHVLRFDRRLLKVRTREAHHETWTAFASAQTWSGGSGLLVRIPADLPFQVELGAVAGAAERRLAAATCRAYRSRRPEHEQLATA
jgi:hypothetical protein